MFDINKAWQELQEIQVRKLLTLGELATDIGINIRTLIRIRDNENRVTAMKVLRKIRDYIEREKDGK